MEEELQKRNTDCVYFLASPLTCKKGIDCEYRHSEIARLNPRDCWYWLSGNCLNPTCGFRHPPLDVHTEAPSESAPLPHKSSMPVNKTSIPCYFYFNGFCNKGDKCSFVHGPEGSTPAGRSLKIASAITDALPSENKTSTGNDTASAPTETHLSLSETAPNQSMDTMVHHKENLQQAAPRNVPQRSDSAQMSASESEEAAVAKLDSFLTAEGFTQSRTHICSDQISEEQVDSHIEPEERWESSPGFDVLVDNQSENLDYEDEPEYLLGIDREQRELNGHYLGYDFEDPVEYDPMYPDAELPYEREMYNVYDHLDNEHIFDNVGRNPGHSREKRLDSTLPLKRRRLPIKLTVDECSGDLRDHLRKRRAIDGHPITCLSRRLESSRLINRSQERPRRHGMGQRLHGRLASEVGMNAIESLGDNGSLPNGDYQHGCFRHSHSNRSRQHYKEKRMTKQQSLSSEVSRKPVSRERRSFHGSSTFSGPKTLAQIKEEKKKVEENGDCFGKMGHSSRTTSADFQGPKPLSEILKDKRTLDFGNTSSS